MQAIKEISANLMPSVLKDFGLEYALNDLCTKISEGGTLLIDLDIHNLKERFDKKTEVALFRIAQELLNNIIKHANASQVDLQLVQHKKSLVFMIHDNGDGIIQHLDKRQHKGLGFYNITSRIKLLDGRMEIDSTKGKGTTITIKIPT